MVDFKEQIQCLQEVQKLLEHYTFMSKPVISEYDQEKNEQYKHQIIGALMLIRVSVSMLRTEMGNQELEELCHGYA